MEVYTYLSDELQEVFQSRVIYDFLKSDNQSNSGKEEITKVQKSLIGFTWLEF